MLEFLCSTAMLESFAFIFVFTLQLVLLSVSTDAERVYSMYRLSINQYHYLICVTFVCTRGARRTSRVRLTLGARGDPVRNYGACLVSGFVISRVSINEGGG